MTEDISKLVASEICCKCGEAHLQKNGPCLADERDNTPLIPGQGDEEQTDQTLYSPNLDEDEQSPKLLDIQDLVDLDEQSPEDFVGHTLVNKYALLALIGKGGMSAVFRAKDLKLNKILAVKLLLPDLATKQINAQRFKMEAQAASSLYHPNLITTHDYGVTPKGMPYIAMDLLDGKSLSELLHDEEQLSIKRAIPIFIQICDALAHAHGKNVLHRDLKPSNIMITEEGSQLDFVKLLDFGIAKVMPADDDESLALTRTGEIFGSPQYMSPEQCSSMPIDARADIYSMGCLMYEVVTGKPPFSGDNIMEILFAQVHETPQDIKKVAPDLELPQKLELIIFKCLAKSPADRYQSASELSADLNKFNQTATDIFIKQIQAKWQVFKLKQKPLRKREKRFLSVAIFLAIVVLVGAAIQLKNYLGDSSLSKLNIKQAFLPKPAPKVRMPLEKEMLSRAMESGLNKRIERMARNPSRSDVDELADAAENVAESYLSYKQYELAQKYFEIAVKLNRTFDPKQSTYSTLIPNLHIGTCLFARAKYKDAIPYFERFNTKIVNLLDGNRDRAYLVESLIYQGSSQYALGEYKSAIKSFNRLFKIIPTVELGPNTAQRALLYCQLADSYRLQGNFGKALKNYQSGLKLYSAMQKKGTVDDISTADRHIYCLYLTGYCQKKLEKYDQALKSYKKVLPKLRKLSNDRYNLEATATSQYADLLWTKSNYFRAIEKGLKARELSNSVN